MERTCSTFSNVASCAWLPPLALSSASLRCARTCNQHTQEHRQRFTWCAQGSRLSLRLLWFAR